jgi:hypothetical protein
LLLQLFKRPSTNSARARSAKWWVICDHRSTFVRLCDVCNDNNSKGTYSYSCSHGCKVGTPPVLNNVSECRSFKNFARLCNVFFEPIANVHPRGVGTLPPTSFGPSLRDSTDESFRRYKTPSDDGQNQNDGAVVTAVASGSMFQVLDYL